jgi:superfamily II DNA or RNA helicase
MTCEFSLSDLSLETRKQIMNDLIFEQTLSSSGPNPVKKSVYAYHVKEGKIILPKYYCTSETSPIKLDIPRKVYEKTSVEFCGELYPEQVESRNECIGFLNKYKSCILSLPVGCGKCLHPDTLVLQYDGSTVCAKDIKRGDVLIGDDLTPRTVLSTTKGVDEMYSIVNNDYNVSYTVNSDHILTVVDVETHKVSDVSLKWLLEHPELVGIKYKGFRISVDTWGKRTRKERVDFINSIFHQYQQFTTNDVHLKDTILQIIYSLGLSVKCKQVGKSYTLTISNGTPDVYPFVIEYKGVGEYCGFELDGNGRFLLGDFTVTHNTATTINLSTKVKLKVLVIVNRLVLVQQWKEAIHQFCPGATIHMLKPKDAKHDTIPQHFDFYIINAINVHKFTRHQLSFIGFVVVDECHLIMSEVLSQCMWRLEPKYLIGLSASPYRLDGLDKMMQVYFGPNKVVKEVERQHVAYKVTTNFTPETSMTRFGKLDWNALINTISSNPERNELIINIVKRYPERYFLLLTKRIDQANALAALLDEADIDHDKLYGVHTYIKSDKHVLIGTTGKCGVGFDAPKLDTLVVCCDMVNYYIQMLGRVMRNKSNKAWVFDLVDDHPTLLKHYYERAKVYKKNGGTIERLDASFFKNENDTKE